MSASELICRLQDVLEGVRAAEDAAGLLQQLVALLESPEAAIELDEVWMDAHPLVMSAAGLSAEGEAAVQVLLSAAAQHCTAREVFTLCMASLSQHLSTTDLSEDMVAGNTAHGPSSPAFQLFLLGVLHSCLPRIRRRPLHFLADFLNMQLRWAAEVLPALPLGSSNASAGGRTSSQAAAGSADGQETAQPLTVAGAVLELACLGRSTIEWARRSQQLSEQEREAAVFLQEATVLQLAGFCLQLPQNLEAGTAALESSQKQQQQEQRSSGVGVLGPAPTAGSRLPLMQAAAQGLAALPLALLAAVLDSASGAGAGADTSATAAAATDASLERVQRLAEGLDDHLAACGVNAAELLHFSAAEAAEGAALAACAAAWGGRASKAQQAQRLLRLLPSATCTLLDLGAQHRSAALTLLPLHALCAACAQVAAPPPTAQRDASTNKSPADTSGALTTDAHQLPAGSPDLDTLLSGLVAIMSHNPVQLVRSCAHDAAHAVLDAFQPGARLVQLQCLMSMPSTAAAVVALQRLRQEMAAAWGSASTASSSNAAQASSSSGSSSGNVHVWLSPAALDLALPCLQRGSEEGWHDEASVLAAADVQSAALSLLRWVLLRERAAPRGLLPAQRAASLLRQDLLPLQACLGRLLQEQATAQAADGAEQGASGAVIGTAEQQAQRAQQQRQLDDFLAAQRLHEVLSCVIDLLLPLSESLQR